MKQEQRTIHLMGTVIQLWIRHENPTELLEKAEKKLEDFERRFSANDAYSDVNQINQQAGIVPVAVDEDLFELIQIGKEHSLAKGSALNIAIGPLVQLWRIGFDDAKLPSEKEIKQRLKLIQPKNILLDEKNRTVFLKKKGMAIDLGALAKGYFADLILSDFIDEGVESALVDLGGNVVTYGDGPNHADGYWRVGIQHPTKERGQLASAVKVKNQSIVTSGIYERTFTVAGKRYHHIFDQQTGYPLETDIASITVISDKSVDGEIWTTRLFGQTPQQIISTLDQMPGFSGIVIMEDGRVFYPKALTEQIIL